MEEKPKRPEMIGDMIVSRPAPPADDEYQVTKVFFPIQLGEVSSATLTAITSAAPAEWHAELKNTWAAFEGARERDLALLTRDPGPIRSHVAALTKQAPRLPDATLMAMADIVLKLRERRRERIWWIVGIIATAIAAPLITIIVQRIL